MSKFNNALAERLYDETPDETVGSVDELGWYGLFKADSAILTEDSQGFVTVWHFGTDSDLWEDWDNILSDYSAFYCEGNHLSSCDSDGYCNDCGEQ